jgi:4-hydroxy-tetrahydrodipicolinate synthase
MHGIGPPLVTPFDEDGAVDYERLRRLVTWMEDGGVDFLVPCGSTSEAALLTADERACVIETVVEEASVPVLAGTGHPGRTETLASTAAAAEAGADAAMVVTPFYYPHDQDTLASYYREVADAADVPIYLYSVPTFTHITLESDTAGDLAAHENIVGMKDSAGSVSALVQTEAQVGDDFDLLVGSASILAQGLLAGASGGVLALANLLPEQTTEIFEAAQSDPERARNLNAEVIEMNEAVTSDHGIPGLKWAMRQRGAPAGYARSPHRPPAKDAQELLQSLLSDVE